MTNYKKGQKVVITAVQCGHEFEIGQVVELVSYNISNNEWEAYDGDETWYLREDEFSDARLEILIKMVESNRDSIKLLTNIVSANEIGLNNVEKDLYGMNKVIIELDEYDSQCSYGCCTDYGTITKVNGKELDCHNQDVGTILKGVLEELGYDAEIIER